MFYVHVLLVRLSTCSKDDTFAAWDESQLRQFLLDQGVVEPKGTREQLAVLARQKYNAYTSYASALSSTLSSKASTAVYGDPTSQASKSVTSAASVVSASASSVYIEASSTVSSVVAQATEQIGRVADDAKGTVLSRSILQYVLIMYDRLRVLVLG
jgi:hypothetical protein